MFHNEWLVEAEFPIGTRISVVDNWSVFILKQRFEAVGLIGTIEDYVKLPGNILYLVMILDAPMLFGQGSLNYAATIGVPHTHVKKI